VYGKISTLKTFCILEKMNTYRRQGKRGESVVDKEEKKYSDKQKDWCTMDLAYTSVPQSLQRRASEDRYSRVVNLPEAAGDFWSL